jgi:hypothetical protein
MSDKLKMGLSIWFLCGIILSVYGITITASGIYNAYNPPAVFGSSLHLDLFWGIVLLATGLVFLILQRPSRLKEQQPRESRQQ